MPTLEEVTKQSLEERLSRMSRTADDLAAAIRGQSQAALVRRPDGKNWAANEVVCHLQDIEEVYFVRFHAMLSNDDPKIYADRRRPTGSPKTDNTCGTMPARRWARSAGGARNPWRCSGR